MPSTVGRRLKDRAPRTAGVRNGHAWSSGTYVCDNDPERFLSGDEAECDDLFPGAQEPRAALTVQLLDIAKNPKRKRPQGASLARATGFEFVKDEEYGLGTKSTPAKTESKSSDEEDDDDDDWEHIEGPNDKAKAPSRPLYSAMLKTG